MARKAKGSLEVDWVEATVPLGKIFLALDNPRHEPVETEPEAIERLCNEEEVYPLARDIVRYGLSPLERLALVPVDPKKRTAGSYYVAEGNRRVCALKLLADPDLAPAKQRKNFEKLAEGWASPVTSLTAPVFRDQDTVRIWLDRTHSGPQGGIGRKTWNADQKQRFSGSSKNKLAQDVLDYAEAEGMITAEERKGKLTTAQRFLNPEAFQETLGIDRTNPNELTRTRPKDEFDAMLKRFVRDLVDGTEVTSRKNKADILQYGRQLASMPGISTTRIEPEPVTTAQPKATRTRRKPRKVRAARHVEYDDAIMQAQRALGNEKLERLYYSITAIELTEHALLICVGAWSFFETLTAVHGRNDTTSFNDYLSKGRLRQMGVPGNTVSLRSAIGRISEFGNTTKHHPIAATFNGDQLNTDMVALRDVISKCISDATP
jgi:hypothetical protein